MTEVGWDGRGRVAGFRVPICCPRAISPSNTISTCELGVLVLSQDTGPWGDMGKRPFAQRDAR